MGRKGGGVWGVKAVGGMESMSHFVQTEIDLLAQITI